MFSTLELQPSVRVAHYYEFPPGSQASESSRYGYCYAFHLIDEGKGKIAVPDGLFNVKKGDLIYFPPKLLHSFISDPDQPLATYNIYCEIWSSEPLATTQHLVWNVADFDRSYLTQIKVNTEIDELPYHLPLQHHGTMIALFAHIVNHYQKSNPASNLIASSLLKAFLLEFIQLSKAPLLTDYRIKPIIDMIDQEANAGRRYETWLALSGMKKTQFHELFKQASGLSPKAYWTQAIMKRAAAALWESNRSVTDLADDLGYSSIHHFTKQFTAFYGVSPSVFRKRRR
ncbi:AraC family transcriptional regulator [Cohnella silvisoli]|uniref:AraC family transcriptional regulator n=1 Tax=Cohnella silvisoli TaxID=2873699 RepID=A0ABV1KM44_9BACL|nr:AraC family transcriptional regulator [Cohnella silvisoli]MCD9020778.1 AraC family transcriptional regulator [Cohnella silvisoli]